jgi:hypothetical protein
MEGQPGQQRCVGGNGPLGVGVECAALGCDGGSSYGLSPITAAVYWVDVQMSFLNLLPAKRLSLIRVRTDLFRILLCPDVDCC